MKREADTFQNLLLGDDRALNLQADGALLTVGLDLDRLLEGARTSDRAVGHLDFSLLTRLDGLGGKFGARASARSSRIDDEQRLVARVGELEGARHGAVGLLDGAEVVALDLEGGLGLFVIGHGTQGHQASGEKHHK